MRAHNMLSGRITPLANDDGMKKVAFTAEASITISPIVLTYQQYPHMPKAVRTLIEGASLITTIHQ